MRENHARMLEDLEFSNPADPKQWPDEMVKGRVGRPTETHDQTNQYINQIVNDARQNTPSIQTLPADSRADPAVAEKLNGLIRHIEYASRAGIAYDTGLEHSARAGLGWLRVAPAMLHEETGEQEIKISRVFDPLSCLLDPNSTEPDGSDAMWGFAEATIPEKAFKKSYPKASLQGFGDSGRDWYGTSGVRVAEYMSVIETKQNRLLIEAPEGTYSLAEDEYWEHAKKIGFQPPVLRTFDAVTRTVKWVKLNGAEVLEETEFPSRWIGLIPVYGHELWIEGKRYLCGMTRRLMAGQRLHNYQMSSLAEQMLMQPKAPFMTPARAIKGHEHHWAALNSGNPSYLPYNDIDSDGQPIPSPQRMAPPPFPVAAANAARLGSEEMQASIGMYKSNLGMQSNSVSGRAKMQDKLEGDTANFHYIDNLRRSMEHLGRIVVDMIPRVYDTARQVRILGLDGQHGFVQIDPEMQQAAKRDPAGKVVAINPGVGIYDVRVKVGPGYTSMRSELQERLAEMSQSNPQLGAALAPLMVKMADLPEAEKVAKVAMALLPPNVQAAYQDGEQAELPPEVAAQIQGMQQQLQQAGELVQQLSAALDEATQAAAQAEQKAQADAALQAAELQIKQQAQDVDAYNAETNRLKAEAEIARAQNEQELAAIEALRAQEVPEPVQMPEPAPVGPDPAVEALGQRVAELAAMQAAQSDAMAQMAATMAQPKIIKVVRDQNGVMVGAVAEAAGQE